jgi:hypothetical protein
MLLARELAAVDILRTAASLRCGQVPAVTVPVPRDDRAGRAA